LGKDILTLERIDPNWLSPKNLIRIWSGRTDVYPLTPIGVKFIWQEHVSRYEFASKLSFGNVLDISCGTGYGIPLLSNDKTNHISGVDISTNATKRSIQLTNNTKGVSILRMDNNCNLGFKSESFDTIVSFETIEHLSDPSQFVREISRVLKPNGLFIVSTPNKDYFSPNKQKPLNEFHHVEFDLESFINLLGMHFRQTTMYSQGSILSENISGASSVKSRLKRVIGMINKSQTSIKLLSNSKPRYYVAVCSKF